MQKIHYNYAILAFGPNDNYFESRDDLNEARELASHRTEDPALLNVGIADLHGKIIEMIKGNDIKTMRGKLRMIFGITCDKGKI